MDALETAADLVARDFLGGALPRVDTFDVTVAKNTLLDCLFSSREPDFIAKACGHALIGAQSRKVVRAMAPHLVALAGRAVQEARR